MFLLRHLLLVVLIFTVAACGSEPKDKITGTRVAVLSPAAKLTPDAGEDSAAVVPDAVVNDAWPQAMGLQDAPLENSKIASKLHEKWRASIGAGAGKRTKLLSRPISANGFVFTLDTNATAKAISLKNGDVVWSQDLETENDDEDQFGGGLAYDDGHVYVTTGYGGVVALTADTGAIEWRASVRDVVRSAPMVYQGRVFVMTVTGQMYALNATSGQVLWTHSGISESSAILGNNTPVISGDVVIAPYNSGELYAVRVQNGRTVWSQSLAGSGSRGAAPAMSDIKSSPAIDAERVYAVSHSGRMAAIDLRSGNGVWDADVGGIDTPILAGNSVYVLADGNTLVALDKTTGRVRKVKELSKFEDDDSTNSAVRWTGPVLAGGLLWVAGSTGQLLAFDAATLDQKQTLEIGSRMSLPPIVVRETLLALTDSGDLVALR